MRITWIKTTLVMLAVGSMLVAGISVQKARMRAHQMPGTQLEHATEDQQRTR